MGARGGGVEGVWWTPAPSTGGFVSPPWPEIVGGPYANTNIPYSNLEKLGLASVRGRKVRLSFG